MKNRSEIAKGLIKKKIKIKKKCLSVHKWRQDRVPGQPELQKQDPFLGGGVGGLLGKDSITEL